MNSGVAKTKGESLVEVDSKAAAVVAATICIRQAAACPSRKHRAGYSCLILQRVTGTKVTVLQVLRRLIVCAAWISARRMVPADTVGPTILCAYHRSFLQSLKAAPALSDCCYVMVLTRTCRTVTDVPLCTWPVTRSF